MKNPNYKDLYKLIVAVKTESEAEKLLKDILTPQELDSLAQRWQIIRELAHGNTQRKIAKKLKISIAKVSRGSRILKYGVGGFKRFLK